MAFLMTALMVVAFVNVVLLLIVILVGLRAAAHVGWNKYIGKLNAWKARHPETER